MSSTVDLRVIARANALNRVCAALQVPVTIEAALARFSQAPRELSTDRAALATAVRELPEPTIRALDSLSGNRFSIAQTVFTAAGNDRFALTEANRVLDQAVAQAQRKLQTTSRKLLIDDVVRFAKASGGTAESCEGANVSSVVIEAGEHRTGAVRISDVDGVSIEWQGLQGTVCRDWTAALMADLDENGWKTTVEKEDYHGGATGDGDHMIRSAAAADPNSLARGIVITAEKQLRQRASGSRRSRRDETDDDAVMILREPA